MEIIGLLGSDISKCAICFPSLPSAMIFDAIPTPSLRVVCDKNPSLANFLPISLFFFFFPSAYLSCMWNRYLKC